MPIKEFSKCRQYAKRAVIVADADFKKFGVYQSVIVLTECAILEGAKVARDYYKKGRLNFAETTKTTYQDLQASISRLETVGIKQEGERRRLLSLIETADAEAVEWDRICRAHRESSITVIISDKDENITKLQDDVQSQKKGNREQAKTLVAQEGELASRDKSIQDLSSELEQILARNWWQRLFNKDVK